MSRYLVTGGTGFIGRWVVSKLAGMGHSVRVFDARPDATVLNDIDPELPDKVELVTGDISDGSVREAAADCDGIAHLAGILTVDAARDPIRAAEINLIGSLHVFEAAKALGIRRMTYVSSAAVFGPEDPVNPWPMTHYGAHKLAIEGAARAYLLDHGISSTGFRPYIVYGPGRSSGIAAGPSIAITSALRGEPATIRFSGRVGFVHAWDVAALMVETLLTDGEGAAAYTLCGETADMGRFCEVLRDRIPSAEVNIDGEPLRIPFDLASSPMPAYLEDVPVTGLDAGIDATIRFYRDRNVQ